MSYRHHQGPGRGKCGYYTGVSLCKSTSEQFKNQSSKSKNLSIELKLLGYRFDAFVIEEVAGLKAFELQGMSGKIQYAPDKPISKMGIFYAFQYTKEGQKLVDTFSKILRTMTKTGDYSNIRSRT